MAQTCVGIPTLTTEVVSTGHSTFTATRAVTSTVPGSSSAVVGSTCSPVGSGNTTTTSCAETTLYTVFPGSTIVTTITTEVVSDFPTTNLITLSGSSCNPISNPTPPVTTTTQTYTPPTTTENPPTYTKTLTTTSTTTSLTLSTPPPTTVVLTSVMSSSGSKYTSTITSTSTFAPTLVPATQDISADPPKKSNIIGPIVGGSLGGLVALLLIGFIIWKLIKRNSIDDMFNIGNNTIIGDPDLNVFDYNPVGQLDRSPVTMSPPAPALQSINDIGPQPSGAPGDHHRTPSQVPLLGAVGFVGPGTGAASISRPVGGMATQMPHGQVQGYPHAHQNLGGTNQGAIQSYGVANTQGGYNALGFAPASRQATSPVPTSSLVPNRSFQSVVSAPSTYTTDSWTGQHQPPTVPIGGSVEQQQYGDQSNRTGSPFSIRDPRILQLANPELSYSRGVYDPNAYYTSSSAGPSSVDGSSQAMSSSVARDGKGRQLHVVGNGAQVGVHLDGGVFDREQQPEPASGPVVQAPPAYSE